MTPDQQAKHDEVKLPPLPCADGSIVKNWGAVRQKEIDGYSEYQMRQYALTAIAQLCAKPDSAEQVPREWKLAPTEPTHEMCEAAHFGPNCAEEKLRSSDRQFWTDCYKAMLAAAPLNIAQQAPEHQEFSDRYKVVRGAFWWQIQIGDGTQKIGKFYTEVEAMRMASEFLRAFRDGEFVAEKSLQSQLSQAKEENARLKADAGRYRWLRDKSDPGICAFYLSVGKAFDGVKFNQETVDQAIDAQISAKKVEP